MDRTALAPGIPGWYIEFQANVLRQLPRPGEINQTTAAGWSNNQKSLKVVLAGALLPSKAAKYEWFELLPGLTIVFTVPDDYNGDTALDDFREKFEKKFNYFNPDITDEHYSNASVELVPGRKYEAQFYLIKGRVDSEDCLAFYEANNYLRVGPRGLTEATKAAREAGKDLPKGRIYFCMDDKKNLWRDPDGDHGVPNVARFPDGGWIFDLDYFEVDWCGGCCLVCLRDLSE